MACTGYGFLVLALLVSFPVSAGAQAQVLTPRPDPADSYGPGKIPARSARQHVGEQATVCGFVTKIFEPSTREDVSRGLSAIINLGEPGPYGIEDFEIIISPADLQNFPLKSGGYGRLTYLRLPENGTACVTGKIGTRAWSDRRVPAMVAHRPSDIIILPTTHRSPV